MDRRTAGGEEEKQNKKLRIWDENEARRGEERIEIWRVHRD